MSRAPKTPANSLPDLHCPCANLRRAARLVTQLYSREMGAAIEPPQFALLTALNTRPGASQSPLGRALGLDKTTMSRNLKLMEKNGWIIPSDSEDKRERGYHLTPAGQKILTATKPGWSRAQTKLRTAMSSADWETMSEIIGRVTEAAQSALQTND